MLEASPESARPWLERALELAVQVAARGTAALARSARAAGPALDAERFRFEMGFFLEHYAGSLLGRHYLAESFRGELHRLADAAADSPRRILCHRDFHSRNLMARPDGSLALVDIQDARWGPDSYDLASLLFDAYIDIDPGLREDLVESYLRRLPDPPDRPAFRRRFERVAAQRMLKALGTFGYQIAVRDRQVYRPAVDRTVPRLKALLPELHDFPALRGLAEELE